MKVEFSGQVDEFYEDTWQVLLSVGFEDLEAMRKLQAIANDKSSICKVTVSQRKLREEEQMNYEQQKKWFASLRDILRHYKVHPSREAMKALYESERKERFPIRTFQIGGQEIKYLPSITSLSWQELHDCISELIEHWTELGVEFTNG